MSQPIIKSLEVHENPDDLGVWGISFIYDSEGEDGDIIEMGSKEQMDELLNSWTSRGVIGLDYDAAIKLIEED